MDENNKIQLFEDQAIRTAWDEEQEEWYFSIVDVVAVLTEQKTPRSASTYWAVLKKRLKEEGADQLLTNCKQTDHGLSPFIALGKAHFCLPKLLSVPRG